MSESKFKIYFLLGTIYLLTLVHCWPLTDQLKMIDEDFQSFIFIYFKYIQDVVFVASNHRKMPQEVFYFFPEVFPGQLNESFL